MSTHPRRPTVLLPRVAAYLGCCALVLVGSADPFRSEVLLFIGWLLALPWLTWLSLPVRTARLLGVAENALVPLGAWAIGLPGVLIAAFAFVLLLGHLNVGGGRQGLAALAAMVLPVAVLAPFMPWPAWPVWREGATAELATVGLVAAFALFAALLTHRQKVQLEGARTAVLRQATAHAALAERLARYLPPAVHRVAFDQEGGTASGSRRRWLTVCFADLAGFTALTDASESEEVVAMLDDFYTAMAEAALAHGGTLDKFIGDAVMIFFGDPTSRGRDRDAQACVAMAAEMQARLEVLRGAWKEQGIHGELGLRIGVHAGWCTVGSFGKSARIEYTVIGATVNVASRLESSAAPGQILLSRATWLLLGLQAARCRRIEPLMAKGVVQPIEAFEYCHDAAITEPLRWRGDGYLLEMDPGSGDRERIRRALAEAVDVLDAAPGDAAAGARVDPGRRARLMFGPSGAG